MSIDMMKMFMLLGDMTNEESSLADKVAYKQRIAFATMRNAIPDWQPPSDWADGVQVTIELGINYQALVGI